MVECGATAGRAVGNYLHKAACFTQGFDPGSRVVDSAAFRLGDEPAHELQLYALYRRHPLQEEQRKQHLCGRICDAVVVDWN